MWLVLTDHRDPLGPWLAEGLRRRTAHPVLALSTLDLLDNRHLDHRVDDTRASFQLRTHDGRVVDSAGVTGVVNRIQSIPPAAAGRLQPEDRMYAMMEMGALLVSCLNAFACPVLNPVRAHAFGADLRLDFEWAALAQQAGLRCSDSAASPFAVGAPLQPHRHAAEAESARVLVVGRVVLTPPDVSVGFRTLEACRRLARAAGAPLLAVDLFRLPAHDWFFAGADPRPDPSSFGATALDAMAETFQETSRKTFFFIRRPQPRVLVPPRRRSIPAELQPS